MNNETKAVAVPEGYRKDADGRLIPEKMIKPIDRARDRLVESLVGKARAQSEALAKFKAQAMSDLNDFVAKSGAKYEVKMGGAKGNVTLFSFDGRYKVVKQNQDTITFDERLQVAKKLIDECVTKWADGSRDEIKVLVNDAFQVSKEGRINTTRILSLKRLNIKDEKWLKAMQAIADSVQTSNSKSYIRFYERVGESDQYRPISLDVATAELTA